MSDRRIMIAAPKSGSGKTLITCGLLAAFRKRGLQVASFKCGPDYIDPMFHSKVLKAKSRNLDTFFTDSIVTRFLLQEGSEGTDLSVMEGVMGYYDGLGGISTRASAYDLASVTETPVVLVVNAKGMSLSVLAELKGFLTYQEESRIRGVILNEMSPMMYSEIRDRIEKELSVRVFGYVPKVEKLFLESRHLGLVLPEEVEDLQKKFEDFAGILENSLDIDGLLALAEEAAPLTDGKKIAVPGNKEQEMLPEELWNRFSVEEKDLDLEIQKERPLIAVARDEAFCFLYEDNLRLLGKLGAELVFFSPIHDGKVPEMADGMILCGGYPELFARELSENMSMKHSVRDRIREGFPCMAECGGFLYLHRSMEDMEGKAWEMAGAIEERAFKTEKLGRFGYITLTPNRKGILNGSAGEIRAHEFHYFDSTGNGADFHAGKPLRKRSWECIHGSPSQMLGFPHLYYYSNPKYALGFLKAALDWKKEHREGGRE